MRLAKPAGPNIPKDNAPRHKQSSPAPRHESASPTPQTGDNRESGIPHPDSASLPPAYQSQSPSLPPVHQPPPVSRNKHACPPPPPPLNATGGNTAAWQSRS